MQELKRDIRVITLVLIKLVSFCFGFTVTFIVNTLQDYKQRKAK